MAASGELGAYYSVVRCHHHHCHPSWVCLGLTRRGFPHYHVSVRVLPAPPQCALYSKKSSEIAAKMAKISKGNDKVDNVDSDLLEAALGQIREKEKNKETYAFGHHFREEAKPLLLFRSSGLAS